MVTQEQVRGLFQASYVIGQKHPAEASQQNVVGAIELQNKHCIKPTRGVHKGGVLQTTFNGAAGPASYAAMDGTSARHRVFCFFQRDCASQLVATGGTGCGMPSMDWERFLYDRHRPHV